MKIWTKHFPKRGVLYLSHHRATFSDSLADTSYATLWHGSSASFWIVSQGGCKLTGIQTGVIFEITSISLVLGLHGQVEFLITQARPQTNLKPQRGFTSSFKVEETNGM